MRAVVQVFPSGEISPSELRFGYSCADEVFQGSDLSRFVRQYTEVVANFLDEVQVAEGLAIAEMCCN